MQFSADVFRLLLDADLSDQGFHDSDSAEHGSISSHAALSLRKASLKKFLQSDSDPNADKAALDLFLSFNERCRTYRLDLSKVWSWESEVIFMLKDIIYDLFYPTPESGFPSFREIVSRMDVGPGASIGSKSNDFFSKIATSELTSTSERLLSYYREAIRCDRVWSKVETYRALHRSTRIIEGSRLSFVPKTSEISRVICTEPICNMLFQKGLGAILEDILRREGINLSTQPDYNKEMARIGSINGRLCTIDLSSASDSISMALCEQILPPLLFKWLCDARSPRTRLPNGESIELHMVSSMGNAFTFPLQTMIFYAAVAATYRFLGISLRRTTKVGSRIFPGNFGVFGDDIVVERDAFDLLVRILGILGFQVNTGKSFKEGHFRESCGGDYYYGKNVRGVYLKTMRTDSDVYSAINRLVRWSARHCILLPRTIEYLRSLVKFLPVPIEASDDAGIKVPLAIAKSSGLIRHKSHGSYSYRFLKARALIFPVDRLLSSAKRSRHFPHFLKNEEGILLAAIAGRLRGGSITARLSRKRSTYRKGLSPRWDFNPYARDESHGFGDDWEVIARLYFECKNIT